MRARLLPLWLAVALASSATSSPADGFEGYFLHGVASGDPRPDAVVIWTRITPRETASATSLPLSWRIWPSSTQEGVANLTGELPARRSSDFTVKVDAKPLQWGVRYSFQFSSGPAFSQVGTFQLPPPSGEALNRLRYAFFSCSHWRWGTFAAYRKASLEQLDFWLHLGDFIYESGQRYPSDPKMAARPSVDPPWEIVSLEDYRRRYAWYRTDEDLQALSASAPSISMWDDHEVTNDVWMGGAANHQPEKEGNFSVRKAAALQAYHEWLPTRVGAVPAGGEAAAAPSEDAQTTWRRYDFGDLATLLMLETRLRGRTSQLEFTGGMVRKRLAEIVAAPGAPAPDRWNGTDLERRLLALKREGEAEASRPEKSILGTEQLQWIRTTLRSAPRWRLIGQQLKQAMAPPALEGAVRLAASSDSPRVRSAAAAWSAALRNATEVGASFVLDLPLPFAKAMNGQRFSITPEQQVATLGMLAVGRYGIPSDFDSWDGYVAERRRLLDAFAEAGAPRTMVYGGDSHNAWAGRLRDGAGRVVAHEFDTMSVSAPGLEFHTRWLPRDLVEAAWTATNPDLAWSSVGPRGYTLVELSKATHTTAFIGVDSSVPGVFSGARCLAVFTAGFEQEELVRGSCARIGELSKAVAGAAAFAQPRRLGSTGSWWTTGLGAAALLLCGGGCFLAGCVLRPTTSNDPKDRAD